MSFGKTANVVADDDVHEVCTILERLFCDFGADSAFGSVGGIELRRDDIGDGDACVVAVALIEIDRFVKAVIRVLEVRNGEQVVPGYLNIRTVAVGYEVQAVLLTGIVCLLGTVLVFAVHICGRSLRVLGQGEGLPCVSPEYAAV